MYSILRITFLVALIGVLATGCSTNLKRVGPPESEYLIALRAEYLASNPDGPHNEYIERGEVVKGMDILEVLASWGHPQRRIKDADTTTERWVYREADEQTKDWIEYTFTFRGNILSDWELARHFAAGGSLPLQQLPAQGSLVRGAEEVTPQSSPKK